MPLRDARERANILQWQAASVLSKIDYRMDKQLFCKAENGAVMLIPEHAKALAEFYGCNITDLYTQKNVDYGIPIKTGSTRSNKAASALESKLYYKLTVRLEKAIATRFIERLKADGYLGVTDWLKQKVIEYINSPQKENAASTGANSQSSGANENISTAL